MNKLSKLYLKMAEFFKGDPERIQHFIKVHSFAKLIGEAEGLDTETLFILEAAALVHDIGIKPAEEKYGKCDGHLQEEEGPKEAELMLGGLGFDEKVIRRVSYLVGHHHTYSDIKGMDYQILVEADFLVNYLEEGVPEENIRKSVEKVFRTETGTQLAKTMYFKPKFQLSETWAQDGLQDLEDFIEEQGIYIRQ